MSTATHAQLAAEITSNIPSGNPATLTAASLRRYLNDQIDSLNVVASTASAVNLSTYQPFYDNSSIGSSNIGLTIYDGSAAVTWGVLNSTTHTIAITTGSSITSTVGISSGSTITSNALSLGSNASVTGFIAVKTATAAASTASQVVAMGTTPALGIYFATGQPTVSSAAQGSLCLSTGGSGPSTRAWVMNSVGTWIGLVAEA